MSRERDRGRRDTTPGRGPVNGAAPDQAHFRRRRRRPCTGIIAHPDVALGAAEHDAAGLVREVSQESSTRGSR
jgi:hypothetical protein